MRIMRCLIVVALMSAVSPASVCAQSDTLSQTGAPADVMAASRETQAAVDAPTDAIIYGEVQAVDPAGGTMNVLYYDYDSDEEKTIDLLVGGGAAIENADGLAAITKGDWADITFRPQDDGTNRVSSIIVERDEEEPVEMTSDEEAF